MPLAPGSCPHPREAADRPRVAEGIGGDEGEDVHAGLRHRGEDDVTVGPEALRGELQRPAVLPHDGEDLELVVEVHAPDHFAVVLRRRHALALAPLGALVRGAVLLGELLVAVDAHGEPPILEQATHLGLLDFVDRAA
mgnify:CR=1 FL=1